MELKKRILIAPLNWGLGHAARCIPIISELIKNDFEPLIASDGDALFLLKKEFPNLKFIEFPSYHIKYAKKSFYFKLKLISNTFTILNAMRKEYYLTQSIIKSHKIDGIISDNRMGVFNKSIPCAYITHQLNVLSGSTTKFSTKLHHYFIKKFDTCWVPDIEGKSNLSGKLSHLKDSKIKPKYLGILSRFKKIEIPIVYDLMVLLSGPEPQRTILEEILLKELKSYKGNILFVKGKMETKEIRITKGNMTIVNFMKSDALQIALNQSRQILCRSGYTSIMDLAKLEKKAFFIPTPGQFEQEYLAKRLKKLNLVPTCKQHKFTVDKLHKIKSYKGLSHLKENTDFKTLFYLFNSE